MAVPNDPELSDSLHVVVRALGLDCITRHIFICADATQPKCVDREASLESWEYLKNRLRELGLDRPQADRQNCVFRTKANCLRLCQQGPIAVIYPDGVWYHSVTPVVIEQIIQQHLLCNQIVVDNVLLVQPLLGADSNPIVGKSSVIEGM
jgi:(2Fe-2S) ferredoxin